MQNEQLRQAQGELEQARERYVALYDYAPVGYLTLSERGLILAANLTSRNLLGSPRSELLALPFSRFVFPEDQDRFYLCLRQAFASQLTTTCELRVRPAAGGVFEARLELLQVSSQGIPVCHLTLSDISDHVRAERAQCEIQQRQVQAENEERLRLAMEAGHLGILDRDLRNDHVLCSERACEILGFHPGEPVSWPAIEGRVHREDLPAMLRACEQ